MKSYKLKLTPQEFTILRVVLKEFDASKFTNYDHSIVLSDIIDKTDYLLNKEK